MVKTFNLLRLHLHFNRKKVKSILKEKQQEVSKDEIIRAVVFEKFLKGKQSALSMQRVFLQRLSKRRRFNRWIIKK